MLTNVDKCQQMLKDVIKCYQIINSDNNKWKHMLANVKNAIKCW